MAKPRVASQGWNRDRRSDAELLVDASRDPEALDEFYKRNFRPMTAYFWHRTRDRDTTSELVAETFTVMLESIGRYDPAKGNPRQWMYGIANNQLKRFWRSKRVSMNARRRLGIQTPPTATTGWEEIEAAEDRIDAARMVEALDRLPARTREAVRLRVMEQLD
ncbi:MAG: sigma-70 family RNA polymerase sigma factor [Acidimicrobiaceae bacterium]|nr:sigma-70 family RNA polymerase sigma factor [Acidimicrobiia bacterium]MCY4492619.1 sigma-70 family RNA polymerase sigma factor [Acidimicrobiaceae bacterium]